MQRRHCRIALFLCLFLVHQSNAQHKIDSIGIFLTSQSPREKIHIHLDKEIYLRGETIWFKVYIITNGKIESSSRNLFSDLYDVNGKRLANFTSPIFDGTSTGQFTLPDSITSQELTIRSFTRFSMADDAIYSKKIMVIGERDSGLVTHTTGTFLKLFTEGGTFINKVANNISFKACGSNGMPFPIRGVIKDNKNHFIDSLHAIHDGMGSFVFYPEGHETYYVEWQDNIGIMQRTDFPVSTRTGIALRVHQEKNELVYFIQNPVPEGLLSELFITALYQDQVMYAAHINHKGNKMVSGKIPSGNIPSGIVQLTVFNKEMQPLAERIVFVNNNDYFFRTEIAVIEKNLEKRGKNTIEIKLEDTSSLTLSIGVVDEYLTTNTGHNILTDLLLSGDLRGNVYQPEQYLKDSSGKMAGYLDLVMQTNGWRKYNWETIFNAKEWHLGEILQDEYINYSGKVIDNDDKPVAGALVNLIMRTKDSSNQVVVLSTDENGVFQQKDLIYFDSATLYYTVSKPKKGKQSIKITPGTNQAFPALDFNHTTQLSMGTKPINPQVMVLKNLVKSSMAETDHFEKDAKLLEEVIVRSKRKDSLELMDEKYSRFYKGTKGGRMYDIMHDPNATSSKNPIDYLITWKLPSRRRPSVFYIDEVATSLVRLGSLRMEQIAFVKFVPDDFLVPFCSGVYIYLKNDDDYHAENEKKLNSQLSRMKMAGFTPVREFYQDDYSIPVDNNSQRIDTRTTLYWQPNFTIDKHTRTARISFYNNDISGKLKVVVEGVNEAGKMTYAEKIIE